VRNRTRISITRAGALRHALVAVLLPLAMVLTAARGDLTGDVLAAERLLITERETLLTLSHAAANAAASARPEGRPLQMPDEDVLLLTFLDVGQGDAVLIRAPSGQAVLYDGGGGGRDLPRQLRALGIHSLDLVIASHNHADHIGGLADVVREFRPRFVLDNGIPHTTQAYRHLLLSIEQSGSQLLAPERRTIRLGEAELQILPPPGRAGWGHNDNSVGVIVRYGHFRASLMGDAEARQFDWWLENHRDLFQPVHVHKASHHGSRNGDTPDAIRTLRPEVVVIGVGSANNYGHPDASVLDLYTSVGAKVYRTDRDGSVRILALPSGEYRVETGSGARAAPLPPRGPPADGAIAATPEPARSSCVDINHASAQELVRIRHVGPERAGQIVRLRQGQPFRSVADLTRVNGIGPARLRDLQAQGLACVR
jgi:competence protein ComEC